MAKVENVKETDSLMLNYIISGFNNKKILE